jgi:hypothetical protein
VGALETDGTVDMISNWIKGRVEASHASTKGMLVGHLDSGTLRATDNFWDSNFGSLPAIQSYGPAPTLNNNSGVTTTVAQSGTPFSGGEWSNASVWTFVRGQYPDLIALPR